MKTILTRIENYVKVQPNKFIIYVIITASVLFYFGFIFGRSFADLS